MVKLTRMFPLLALIVGVVFSVFPAEGATINSGTGTGIGDDPGNTSVNIVGQLNPADNPIPCRAFATVLAVVNTQVNLVGSDVFPFNDGLFLVLPLDSSSTSSTCLYTGFGPPYDNIAGPPSVSLTVGAGGNFILRYGQGTYVSGTPNPFPPPAFLQTTPRGECRTPGGRALPPGLVALTMAVDLHGGPGPNIDIDATVNWCSSGTRAKPCNYLSFPPGPC